MARKAVAIQRQTQDDSGDLIRELRHFRLEESFQMPPNDGADRYNVNKYPFNSVVLLEATTGAVPGRFSQFSGAIIGPHTILTCSHGFFINGRAATDISIFRAFSDTPTPQPNDPREINTRAEWHYYKVGESGYMTKAESQWDYAVINVKHRFTSWFGFEAGNRGGRVHLTGYAGSDNGLQRDTVGRVHRDSNYSVLDYDTVSAKSGMSGGPIWYDDNPGAGVSPYVIGVCSTSGWGFQITNKSFNQIKTWVRNDGYGWGGRTQDEQDRGALTLARKDLSGFDKDTSSIGPVLMSGDEKDNRIELMAGHVIVAGDLGADVFVIMDGGRHVITDFDPGQDRIDLSALNLDIAVEDLISQHARQIGNRVVIDIPDQDETIVLRNTTIAELSAADFVM